MIGPARSSRAPARRLARAGRVAGPAAPVSVGAAVVIAAVVIAGCPSPERERKDESPVSETRTAESDAGARAADATPAPAEPGPPEPPPLLAAALEGEQAALAEIGAVPAWEVVVERGRYLARRGRDGAVWGRLGPADGAYWWLVDETEGGGALAIRVAFPAHLVIEPEHRVVVWGAWEVDDARQWYFRAERAAMLEAPPEPGPSASPDAAVRQPDSGVADAGAGVATDAGAPPASPAPGHTIAVIAAPPDGAIAVSEAVKAASAEPRQLVFEVVRAPVKPGDSWEIADRSRGPALALLVLPGERASYGGQDLRAPSERWTLERGARYAVAIDSYRLPRRTGDQPRLRAIGPPREVRAKARSSARPGQNRDTAPP